jgi:hypothetical protein
LFLQHEPDQLSAKFSKERIQIQSDKMHATIHIDLSTHCG